MTYLAFLFSVSLSLIFLYLAIPFLSRHVLDLPNTRSSHIQPIPRGGGVVFLFITIFSFILAQLSIEHVLSVSIFLPLLCMPLAFLGFIDDLRGVPIRIRFSVQLITAFILIFFSPLNLSWFLVLFFVIFVSAVINFTNFMDGIDGLLGGCMFFVMLSIAFYLSAPWPSWTLPGALLGFLFFNWSPAKVFMGDVGSTFWEQYLPVWFFRLYGLSFFNVTCFNPIVG